MYTDALSVFPTNFAFYVNRLPYYLRSDPKKFWRIINNTIINNNSKNGHINLVNNDGIGLSLEHSCSYMNDYLVSIGDNLEREFCNSNTNVRPPRHYMKDQLLNDNVITKEDVLASQEIDNSKGSGMDLIILKDAFSSIPTVVAYLMNQSLKTGIFPKDCMGISNSYAQSW